MDILTFLKTIRDQREGRVKGIDSRKKRAANKPGREMRDGVVHYDGSGPSGYSGPATARPLTARPVMLVPIESLPPEQRRATTGGKKSRRVRKNQWVPA